MYEVIGQSGLLTVVDRGSHVEIEYTGNMGASLENVQRELANLYGTKNVYRKLRSIGKVTGHPSYMWTMLVPADKFFRVTKTAHKALR